MKRNKVAKLADQLMPWQVDLLVEVLSCRAVVLYIHGAAYAASRDGETIKLQLFSERKEYHVSGTGCTCPDSKFRRRMCKHMEAVRCSPL